MAATHSVINPRAFSIVVAADLAGGIGKDGGLPFRLRKDMAYFVKVTSTIPKEEQQQYPANLLANACIMGRKTWESIPPKFRPLHNRFNIIVTRDPKYLDDKPEKDHPMLAIASSFDAALDLVVQINDKSKPQPVPSRENLRIPRIFCVGGTQIYNLAVQSDHLDYVFLTNVRTVVENMDAFFPDLAPYGFKLMPSDKGHDFIESFVQEPVQGGIIEEGQYQYEFTVYTK
ncbi:dihydrofolate reductase [Actinomortierella ambigua]|nr:dihydrofolate reductase [Actinomortierella ambigua]